LERIDKKTGKSTVFKPNPIDPTSLGDDKCILFSEIAQEIYGLEHLMVLINLTSEQENLFITETNLAIK
jgi:hypothetical protein